MLDGGIMKNSKLNKIIMLVVILSMVFVMTADAITFTDISNHWAKNYIEKVAGKGLVEGYKNKTFKPDNNVTVLESLVMLSRLYNIDGDLKEQIVEKYEPSLKKMSNAKDSEWSFEYLSVIIELGVVSENGIRDMFAKKTIFQDASREEIAVLLTKAMLLEDETNVVAYVLPFNDAEKISDAAKPYVYVMYDKKILQGDRKKNINPSDSITRAEIATVLDRAYNYIGKNNVYPEFEDYATNLNTGIITKISDEASDSYIYVRDSDEVERVVKINDETHIYVNGKGKKFSDLKEDMIVKCNVDEDGYAEKIQVDNTKNVVKGTIYYVAYSNPRGITIYDEDDNKLSYDVSSDVDVSIDGNKAELSMLNKDDEVNMVLDGKKVIQINASSKAKSYKGKITSIDYTAYPIKISIKTKEGVVKNFEFNNQVNVIRNDEKSSFDKVRVGDECEISTEYDKMIKIVTTSEEAEIKGIIKEITIGPVNKIEVEDSDGNTKQYNVNSSAVITIGDKNASINDLRVGFNVNMNTSGDEIVSIEVSEIQSVINFMGRVILINEDEKFIKIYNTDKNSGSSVVDLEVTKNTKIFNLSGRTMRFDDIEDGQNIVVSAVTQGLEYIAVSIILQ